MVDELHSMGIKVIVSVWPSVDRRSENFGPMMSRGLLIKTERGAAQTYDYMGDCVEIDPFNPETREYVWEVCKKITMIMVLMHSGWIIRSLIIVYMILITTVIMTDRHWRSAIYIRRCTAVYSLIR